MAQEINISPIKKELFNPNFVYVMSFSVPFLVYTLQWSTLYPPLSWQLFLFYGLSFIICLILGYITNHAYPFRFNKIKYKPYNVVVVTGLYALYALEIAYMRRIPLLDFMHGVTYGEDAFGIPVLHTFIISFSCFYGLYIFHQYISSGKRGLLVYYFATIVPLIFLVYRSSILSILVGSMLIYLVSRARISFKVLGRVVCVALLIFYLFGYLGNIRSADGDPTYIPRASGATEQFLKSWIPKEYYWTYLYIASPVANLQNNINYTKYPEGSFVQLVENEWIPGFVVKGLPFLKAESIEFNQINPFLNVGTIYVESFTYQRWLGIIAMVIYFLTVINIVFFFIVRSKEYGVTGLAILCNVIIFANFHNTIAYSTTSVQLLYPIVFSMVRGLKFDK